MNLYDLKTEEEWQEILDDVSGSLTMPAAFVSPDGFILQESGDRHELCRAIRGKKESLMQICAKTQRTMSREAKGTHQPVIVSCEARMSKCLIPVFSKGEFMGSVVVCGTALPDKEIDPAMIAESICKSEEEVIRLMLEVPVVDNEKVTQVSNRILSRINSDL